MFAGAFPFPVGVSINFHNAKLPIHAYPWRRVGTTFEKGRRLV
jgi:hypothetical protein